MQTLQQVIDEDLNRLRIEVEEVWLVHTVSLEDDIFDLAQRKILAIKMDGLVDFTDPKSELGEAKRYIETTPAFSKKSVYIPNPVLSKTAYTVMVCPSKHLILSISDLKSSIYGLSGEMSFCSFKVYCGLGTLLPRVYPSTERIASQTPTEAKPTVKQSPLRRLYQKLFNRKETE